MTNNGEGSSAKNSSKLTPGEEIVLRKLMEMEDRLARVEQTHAPEMTQVISKEHMPTSSKLALMENPDPKFLYVATEDYTGPICEDCHMPPKAGCRKGGVIGIDPNTKALTNGDGLCGSFVACDQKLAWRKDWEPRPALSGNEIKQTKTSSTVLFTTSSEIRSKSR